MNNCVLYGRLAKDVEIRYSNNGMAVSRFSIAVNRTYQADNKKTDFFNVVAFGKTAENMEKFFRKGSRIVLRCHAQQEEYTNKEGQKVNTVDFIVDGFSFVDTRAEGGITQNQNMQSIPPQMPSSSEDGLMNILDGIDETLPFN